MVIVMEVRRAGAGGDEQAGPVVKRGSIQLHAADVVARKGPVSCSCSFPDALDGGCTSHLSRSLETTYIKNIQA